MARKKHAAAHENHERWLLTYADMITLLVAFFIMLYAMSIVSKEKFDQLALSVRSGFDGNTKMQAVALSPGTGIAMSNALISPQHAAPIRIMASEKERDQAQEKEEESMAKVQAKVQAAADKEGIGKMLDITEDERGLDIRIMTDNILFAKGDGHLRPGSESILDAIASAVQAIPNDIAVEGHTDNLSIHTDTYPTNWELSTERATSVVRYFIEWDNIPAVRFSASGYADTRPLLPNTSPDNQARNRRVEIVVLRTNFM